MKPNLKERAIHRLKIIQGQIRGLEKMVEEEEYCIDILNQSSSVQESIKSLDVLLLQNHLETCAINQIKRGENKKTTDELLRIYRLSKKSG